MYFSILNGFIIDVLFFNSSFNYITLVGSALIVVSALVKFYKDNKNE